MKFYDWERELAELGKVEKQTGNSARMTVLTGGRRVGKTLLALEFAQSRKHLHLFRLPLELSKMESFSAMGGELRIVTSFPRGM